MHTKCFVCGKENCSGLGIEYRLDENGKVRGSFLVSQKYQDGTGVCHRGIILTLLDSAMVHTLLQRNLTGLTVKLDVSFIEPIPVETRVSMSAVITEQHRELYYMTGKVYHGDTVYARGEATFFVRHTNGLCIASI